MSKRKADESEQLSREDSKKKIKTESNSQQEGQPRSADSGSKKDGKSGKEDKSDDKKESKTQSNKPKLETIDYYLNPPDIFILLTREQLWQQVRNDLQQKVLLSEAVLSLARRYRNEMRFEAESFARDRYEYDKAGQKEIMALLEGLCGKSQNPQLISIYAGCLLYQQTGDQKQDKLNQEQAFKLFRQAIDMGDQMAPLFLAQCFYDGKGIGKDQSKALEVVDKLGSAGYFTYQEPLGEFFFFRGRVYYDRGEKDNAFSNLSKAHKECRNWKARELLSACYAQGIGVDPDAVKSAILLNGFFCFDPVKEFFGKVRQELVKENKAAEKGIDIDAGFGVVVQAYFKLGVEVHAWALEGAYPEWVKFDPLKMGKIFKLLSGNLHRINSEPKIFELLVKEVSFLLTPPYLHYEPDRGNIAILRKWEKERLSNSPQNSQAAALTAPTNANTR